MSTTEESDQDVLLIHFDPRDFLTDLKVYLDVQEKLKGQRGRDLSRLREIDLIIPKLQEEKQQKSVQVFQAKDLLDRFKLFYSYGKDTGGISDDRKKRSDLDEKHFNLRLERDVMIDQIITLQDECKRLIKILNQDIPRVNFAEAFFDFYGREVLDFSIFTLTEPYAGTKYLFLPFSVSREIRYEIRDFTTIREDSVIGKLVYRKEKGSVIELPSDQNRTFQIEDTRAPTVEEMNSIAELFHAATTRIDAKPRRIRVTDRWSTGSHDRFQDGARDDMSAICGYCGALLFSTSHLKGCRFYISP